MTKTLIIAEKPSVAADIAKALGGFTKHDDYFESDEYVLSSAVGHLLEITVLRNMTSNAANGVLHICR
jgi:DNA topoisomerase-3